MNGDPGEPPSPCIGICKLDPTTGLCRGCRRTLDEIARWTSLGTAEKQAVLKQLGSRREGHEEDNHSRRGSVVIL